jgi:hypothetical protein
MDTRKGLYSYEALQTRLAENTFAGNGIVDFSHPIIRLASLSQEDLYVLLTKIRHVFAEGNIDAYLISDTEVQGFMQHCFQRVGEAYFRTPRNTITAFVNLLAVLDQNPEVSVEDLIGKVTIEPEQNPDLLPFEDDEEEGTLAQPPLTETVAENVEADDDLASFKL